MPQSQKTQWLAAVIKILDGQEQRVFGIRELAALLTRLPLELTNAYRSPAAKVQALQSAGALRAVDLFLAQGEATRSEPTLTKYAYRHTTPYEIALSLRPESYISHYTAATLHGLSPSARTVYVNKEQSPKPRVTSQLSQAAIDRAFAGKARQTTYVLTDGKYRYVLLNGKHTNNRGVVALKYRKRQIQATDLERTVIDLVVRPQYAGGATQVLQSVRAARSNVSTSALIPMLVGLDYLYPYHQALGFYLEAAGFPADETKGLMELGITYGFYLEQGAAPTAFNEKWRIHYPLALSQYIHA